MANSAFLEISHIVIENSLEKDKKILTILKDSVHNEESVILYIAGLIRHHSLPVKQILLDFLDFVEHSEDLTTDKRIALYQDMLTSFSPPTAIVLMPHAKTIINLTAIYEKLGHYEKAVTLQKTIHIDSLASEFHSCHSHDAFKIQLHTNIATNLIKLGQTEDAKEYIFKVDPLISKLSNDPKYTNLTKTALKTSIRIVILLGKWQEAATRLLPLNNEEFDLDIVKYTLFSLSGHIKSNLLRKLNDSPRIIKNAQQTPLYLIYKKMLQEELIYHEEYSNALNYILETQTRATQESSGEISLDHEYLAKAFARASVESNLIAASHVYKTTAVENFTSFLKLDTAFVEDVTGEMIRGGRLNGTIDDIEKVIVFGTPEDAKNGLKSWNKHINDSCVVLDSIVSDISLRNPKLAERVLAVDDDV